MVFGDYFGDAIQIRPEHEAVASLKAEFTGVFGMILHAFSTTPFWLSLGGILTAWFLYLYKTEIPGKIRKLVGPIYTLLDRKYYIDEIYSWVFAGGTRMLGTVLWKIGDVKIIDGFFVNGSARVVALIAAAARQFQSGYFYHYAFTMIVGIFVLMSLWLFYF